MHEFCTTCQNLVNTLAVLPSLNSIKQCFCFVFLSAIRRLKTRSDTLSKFHTPLPVKTFGFVLELCHNLKLVLILKQRLNGIYPMSFILDAHNSTHYRILCCPITQTICCSSFVCTFVYIVSQCIYKYDSYVICKYIATGAVSN